MKPQVRWAVIGAVMGLAFLSGGSNANAAVVTYIGFDDAQASPIGTNSAAAQASFLSAVGPVTDITFETPIPSSVSIGGANFYGNPPSISNGSLCAFQYCGGNTTPGGTYYLVMEGGDAIFNFTKPIDFFGAYFTGLQIAGEDITFNDGASQQILLPYDYNNGGMAFAGFTDFGASISSVTITVSNDVIGVDDVLIPAISSTPLPSTWTMLIAGFAGLGFFAYRGTKTASAAVATA